MRTIDSPDELLEVSAAVANGAARITRALARCDPATDARRLPQLAAEALWLADLQVAVAR